MPSLPLELERLIFELAVLQDADHDQRMRIMLVAKRVYEWIRPILYRVAIVEVKPRQIKLGRFHNPDVASLVRDLLIISTVRSQEPHILKQLSTFCNVENLAIWGPLPIGPQVLEMMAVLPLRMICVDLEETTLDEAVHHCPIIKTVTHLELITLKGSTWDDYKGFVEFTKLTHLCFNKPVNGHVVLDLLNHCSSLRVVLYLLEGAEVEVGKTVFRHVDSLLSAEARFLILKDHMKLQDFRVEWKRSANGRIGSWELADIIIEARNNNFFTDWSCIFSRRTWMKGLNDEGMQWYAEWSRGREDVGQNVQFASSY